MSMAENSKNFFVCTTCLTKDRLVISKDLDSLVSIDDFKHRYVHQMLEEMSVMGGIIKTNLNHMENSMRNTGFQIEEDFKKIEENLISFIKSVIKTHKSTLISKYKESNEKNQKSLLSLANQISEMINSNEETLDELCRLLNTRIEDSESIKDNI